MPDVIWRLISEAVGCFSIPVYDTVISKSSICLLDCNILTVALDGLGNASNALFYMLFDIFFYTEYF